MTDTETETASVVVVVGMNRTRLLKIMAMVNDEEDNDQPVVEHVPCVAIMDCYENEDSEQVRYMSNFVYKDGSPMNQFFDDEGFRESLTKIIMVGYEWQTSDKDLIQKYFEMFSLEAEICCVEQNPGFSSLDEEMQHFKNLTPPEKEEHASNHTMGPSKMKQFILDNSLPKPDGVVNDESAAEAVDDEDAENAENDAKETEKEPLQERIPQSIDPNLTSFACRMCRTVLLSENHISKEVANNEHTYGNKSGKNNNQSLFCDESVLEWLAPQNTQYDVEGKLTCPNCQFKVGHWNWSGACFYGTWVVPAIQIPLGKIDVVLPESERFKASSMVIVTPKAF